MNHFTDWAEMGDGKLPPGSKKEGKCHENCPPYVFDNCHRRGQLPTAWIEAAAALSRARESSISGPKRSQWGNTKIDSCESFHAKFNKFFKRAHPNIFLFFQELKDCQIEVYIKINSCDTFIDFRRSKQQKKRKWVDSVIKHYEQQIPNKKGEIMSMYNFKL